MDEPNTPITCVKYIPGDILVVRYRNPELKATGSRFELGEIVESVALEAGDGPRRFLERIAVPVGLELRFLQLLGRQPAVLATSLNYLGASLSASAATISRSPLGAPKWMVWDYDTQSTVVTSTAPRIDPGQPLIVAVDTSEDHCASVLETARKASEAYRMARRATLVGIFSPIRGTLMGLYEYLKLANALMDLDVCPEAVVMSVDFGIACLEDHGVNPLEGMASLASYSFPVFETTLSIIVSTCATKPGSYPGKNSPAIFAAAGNRAANGVVRHRLAYPALRPEIFAVTHSVGEPETHNCLPSATSDLPLSHDLKPVFAVPESLASRHGARVDGTSFAAPWCAAWYASLRANAGDEHPIRRHTASPLARIAALQRLCRPATLSVQGSYSKRVTPVSLVAADISYTDFRSQRGRMMLDATSRALADLNAQFPSWEFVLTGSAATILASMPDGPQAATSKPDDIDLAYLGEDVPGGDVLVEISGFAGRRLGPLSAAGEGDIRVDLSSAAGRVAPLSLFQCIIPAAGLFVTAGGVLDAWGGRDDIESGRIRIIEPAAGELYRHPHAIAEHYARLPSLLVALSVTCRLQTSWEFNRVGVFPDLAEPVRQKVLDAVSLDSVQYWTQRVEKRIAKLADSLKQYIRYSTKQVSFCDAPNLCEAISTLQQILKTAAGSGYVTGAWLWEFIGAAQLYAECLAIPETAVPGGQLSVSR